MSTISGRRVNSCRHSEKRLPGSTPPPQVAQKELFRNRNCSQIASVAAPPKPGQLGAGSDNYHRSSFVATRMSSRRASDNYHRSSFVATRMRARRPVVGVGLSGNYHRSSFVATRMRAFRANENYHRSSFVATRTRARRPVVVVALSTDNYHRSLFVATRIRASRLVVGVACSSSALRSDSLSVPCRGRRIPAWL